MTVAHFATDHLSGTGAPRPRFDPLGLVSGWRAWRTFVELDALSDEALAARGLTRRDVPRVAFERMRADR